MKKILLTIGIALSMFVSTFAAYIENVPTHLVQPNGNEINIFTTGDEYYHWMHDENNFTIIRNAETGFYVYATKAKNGSLIPTELIVGVNDPATNGLTPGINLEGELLKETIQSSPLWFDPTATQKSVSASSAKITSNFMNQLVVFISFSNSPDYNPDITYYENNFNGVGVKSVKDFFDETSGGFFDINTTFYPDQGNSPTIVTYVDPHTREYYMLGGDSGYAENERAAREHELLKNAVESIASQVPSTLDIDANDDGNVDNVVFIVQGGTNGWSNLLWPHRWVLYSHNVEINGLRVWDYNFVMETSGSQPGVLSHELFHSFGAPDLYRYTDKTITPVGGWDLMASTPWSTPIHMNTYYKRKFAEWGPEIPEITEAGTYTLEAISSNPFSSYKIAIPNAPNQFLLLEYRKKEGLYETALPGEGLVIFRINESLHGNANGPDDEVYVYRPGGELLVNGTVYQAAFSSTNNRTVFNDFSDPHLFTTEGDLGGFGSYGITNVTALGGNTISFDFSPAQEEEEGDIAGPSCLSANTNIEFSLNYEHRINMTGASWWYEGSSYGVQTNNNEPWKGTITTGPYFSSGRICVGANYNATPYYQSFCKEISVCGAAKHNQSTLVSADEVAFGPNPATDFIMISDAGNFNTVIVSDAMGNSQPVSYETSGKALHLNISHLEKGIYTIIISNDNSANTFKFIKQ